MLLETVVIFVAKEWDGQCCKFHEVVVLAVESHRLARILKSIFKECMGLLKILHIAGGLAGCVHV